MTGKTLLDINVLDAARDRIAVVFDELPKVYVSFSAGKDSTVLLHLVAEEARKRNRQFGILLVDLEAQYDLTIEHALECREMYPEAEFFWVSLPLSLRNAVSAFEPKWTCWDPDAKESWVREPPRDSITDPEFFDWFTPGMEFEEFVPCFGDWYADGKPTGCFVGIRTQESLNRWRSIRSETKESLLGKQWTTRKSGSVYNAYPLYDWTTEDIWTYHARYPNLPYNKLYDRMYDAGLTIHQARICQPYGDDQRRGLWLFQVIEPETWPKVLARVTSANFGSLYATRSGNILGWGKIDLPEGHTWESFSRLLLETMPEVSREHYKTKIAAFLKWWQERGYPNGIPDTIDRKLETGRKAPSWRRIGKVLLKQDWWCKGLSFSQHTSNESYWKYRKIMKERRKRWKIL